MQILTSTSIHYCIYCDRTEFKGRDYHVLEKPFQLPQKPGSYIIWQETVLAAEQRDVTIDPLLVYTKRKGAASARALFLSQPTASVTACVQLLKRRRKQVSASLARVEGLRWIPRRSSLDPRFFGVFPGSPSTLGSSPDPRLFVGLRRPSSASRHEKAPSRDPREERSLSGGHRTTLEYQVSTMTAGLIWL